MLIFFIAIISLSAAMPLKSVKYATADCGFQNETNIDLPCETPECIHAASMLLKNMDQSVDSCDDFYQFACGRLIKETIIPEDKGIVNSFSLAGNKIKEQLQLGMTQEMNKDNPNVFNFMKSYYDICMGAEKQEQNGKKDLFEIMKNLGGWPILEGPTWNETNFDWKKLVYPIAKMGCSDCIFISMNIVTDYSNSSRRIIQITTADLKCDGLEVPGVHMNSKELETNFTGVSWGEWINEILAPHAHIDQSYDIIIDSPEFLDAFSKLLNSTTKRTIANYALWRVALHSARSLGEFGKNIADEFDGSSHKQEPRWKLCINHMSNYFDVAISSFFVRRYFDTNAKDNIYIMVKNIQNSMHKLIDKAEWMDNGTKIKALEKLNAIKLNIAYPNELSNNDKLDEYYKNLKLYPESFLKTELSLTEFEREKEFSSFRNSVEENSWITFGQSLADMNAWYLRDNTMNIPAGILHEHYYNRHIPNYMNYGMIGWIIGHELIHAFDQDGSLFDKNGNFVNWWENDTRKKYLEKAKCIIDQYSNYRFKEVNKTINGAFTQDENIADNSGLKASYYAYNQWANKNVRESRLPGFDYTLQQMFWINAASTSCQKMTTHLLNLGLTSDPHSPGKYRVIGTLSNTPEFSKDFHCPLGSPMNPVEKCSIW